MAFSKKDWENLVRKVSVNTDNVTFTKHAIAQMKARGITRVMALDVLRKGVIHREPEPDIKTGHTKCTMQRFVAGKPIGVVAACEDESSAECVVVTAFIIGE